MNLSIAGINSFMPMALNIAQGLLFGFSMLCYGNASRLVGSPSISIDYISKLLFNPYFLLAIGLNVVGVIGRMWVIELVGVSRTQFISPIIFITSTLLILIVAREKIEIQHWVGALIILFGALMVSK